MVGFHSISSKLRDSLCRNFRRNQVNRILGDDNVLGRALVELSDGTGVLVLALNQQVMRSSSLEVEACPPRWKVLQRVSGLPRLAACIRVHS